MSALAALPTALVATHVFGALDFASHCRLARVDRRHRAIAQLPQASPIELAVTYTMPASVWQRPGMRPRRITDERTGDGRVMVGSRWAASLADTCARVDTLELADADHPLLLTCATRLTTLRLQHVAPEQWRRVTEACTVLTSLEVMYATPLSIDLVAHPPSASLRSLRLAMTSLMSKDLHVLRFAYPRLALLEFNCPRFAECAGELEFPYLTRLEVLCGEWSDYGAPTDPPPVGRLTLTSLPRLARLQLTGNGVDAHRALSVLTALEVLDARHSLTDRADDDDAKEDETAPEGKTVAPVVVVVTSTAATVAEAPALPLSPPPPPVVVCWPRLKSLAIRTVEDVRGIRFPFATLTELYVSLWSDDKSNTGRSCSYGNLDVSVGALIQKCRRFGT
jgi:hypothetical protein